jgi:hypothetical protein
MGERISPLLGKSPDRKDEHRTPKEDRRRMDSAFSRRKSSAWPEFASGLGSLVGETLDVHTLPATALEPASQDEVLCVHRVESADIAPHLSCTM